jgi:hypothetical protein
MKILLSFVLLTCMGSASVAAMNREARARSYSDPLPVAREYEGHDVDGNDFTPCATTSQSPNHMRVQDQTDADWFEETVKMIGLAGATAIAVFLTVQQTIYSSQ